jgi:hypothetical protein
VGDISVPNVEDIEDKRQLPSIALGLYLAAASIGLDAALESVFAMMEPRLARQLMRFGIRFHCGIPGPNPHVVDTFCPRPACAMLSF